MKEAIDILLLSPGALPLSPLKDWGCNNGLADTCDARANSSHWITGTAFQPWLVHCFMIVITPSGKALGAGIQGVNLKSISEADFEAIRKAWLDYLVLLFCGAEFTDEDFIAFSRRFGDLDRAPIQETGHQFVDGYPEIYVVSNVVENGVPIGSLGAGEATWHTDMSYLENPPKASMLYALEIPAGGGDTWFCNMYLAYECLPGQLMQRIPGLNVKHDGTYNSGGYVRHGVTAVDDPVTSPGAYHPLVCRHPETGRRVLVSGEKTQRLHLRAIADRVGIFTQ